MSDVQQQIIHALDESIRRKNAEIGQLRADNARLRAALKQERKRCIKIAETEPEAPGDMPPEFHLIPLEDAIRAAIRATKKSIARRLGDK